MSAADSWRGHRGANHVRDLVAPIVDRAHPLRRRGTSGGFAVAEWRRDDLVVVRSSREFSRPSTTIAPSRCRARMGGADRQRPLVGSSGPEAADALAGGMEVLRVLVRARDRRDSERRPAIALVRHAYCGGGVPRARARVDDRRWP